jgi:hypothetical protein
MKANLMKTALFAKPGFTLFALFFASVLAFLERQLLNILVRPIRTEIGISDVEFSVLQGAAFALLYCIAAFPIACRLFVRASWHMPSDRGRET